MKKVISSLVIASCTVIATPMAWACPPMHEGQPCDRVFAGMDTNKDGTISQKEFDAFHGNRFKQLDSNHDGKLSEEEMQASYPQKRGHGDALISKRFEAADTNHDGALTREEAKDMQMLSQHFDEIDTNKDGKVTPEEMKAMMEEFRASGGPGNAGRMPKKE